MLKKSGVCESVGNTGDVPLGAAAGYEFCLNEHILEAGDTVIFFTDGVTEVMSPAQELYGIERFKKLLEDNSNLPPEELLDVINRRLAEFQEDGRSDDLTLLILRREPA